MIPQLRSEPEVEARATVTAPFRAAGAAAASLVEKVMPGRRDGCGETALASCEDESVWIAAARAASTASDETRAVEAALADGADDTHELQQRIRRVVGKWVNSTHRRRPMIIPVVVEA